MNSNWFHQISQSSFTFVNQMDFSTAAMCGQAGSFH